MVLWDRKEVRNISEVILVESSHLLTGAVESLMGAVDHYLADEEDDCGTAIREVCRATELLFKEKLRLLGEEYERKNFKQLVKLLSKQRIPVSKKKCDELRNARNEAEHEGRVPNSEEFQRLMDDCAFPLLWDFMTNKLGYPLKEFLPPYYRRVVCGDREWNIRCRGLALGAMRNLVKEPALAVRMGKKALEGAVRGLAYGNKEMLEAAARERAGEGHHIPPIGEWHFGDVLEAFVWPVGDGLEDYVPYCGFILEKDVERIKESIIPPSLRGSPPFEKACRFVGIACYWVFRFADPSRKVLGPPFYVTELERLRTGRGGDEWDEW